LVVHISIDKRTLYSKALLSILRITKEANMKVFFPIRWIDVPASPPHEGNPSYRVSFGVEAWDGGDQHVHVYKVQMAYGGRVHGRKSPSYPAHSDDFESVLRALHDLKKGKGVTARGKVLSGGG
jgi:hypothetical protein